MRYLTKSRFKLALECPTKLFYTNKREYGNRKNDNDFLKALADGGFQVGELAKLYYPGGIEVLERKNIEQAIEQTIELLKKESVIIFEGAIVYQNLLIRADIIEKKNKSIRLIEVKSKSIDPSQGFLNKSGYIESDWVPYLYDVAFQKHVIKLAYPEFQVDAYMMLADKTSIATVDGLNQNFLLCSVNGERKVKVGNLKQKENLGTPVLAEVCVNNELNMIYEGTALKEPLFEGSFHNHVNYIAERYEQDILIRSSISSKCKSCEFHTTPDEKKTGLISGFELCWKREAGFHDEDFRKPSSLDIWDIKNKNELLIQKKYFQSQISRADLEPKKAKKAVNVGMSRVDRQMIQVEKSNQKDLTPFFLVDELGVEIDNWEFPYHFIDFETSRVAIPFHKGRRPYEQIAFQFSHHIVEENGTMIHKSQWLQPEPGEFPNFNFVRELRNAIGERGTIFRYSYHENTVLRDIRDQLMVSKEQDKEELCNWLKTITDKKETKVVKGWKSTRKMVDLCDLVKRFYYHPLTNGSNSIKAVLPAILNQSAFLKEKYSKPVYGTSDFPSLNFHSEAWIKFDNEGNVINPYKMLKPMFEGFNSEEVGQLLSESVELQEGGAAMTAYALMQYTEMSDRERDEIRAALLRYCELDTLAMVMIYEHWKEITQ